MRQGLIRATQLGAAAAGGNGIVWTQTQGGGAAAGIGGWHGGGGGGGTQVVAGTAAGGASQAGPRESSLAVRLRAGQDAARLMPPPPARKHKPEGDGKGAGAGAVAAAAGDDEEDGPSPSQPQNKPVVLYRRYKAGELPDIQIPLRDLLRPLQALTLLDAAFARQLFVLLFAPLFARAAADVRQSVLEGLRQALEGALEETELVAGLHTAYRAAMEVGGQAELSPRLAAASGLKSLNYHSAVLLLEEQLLRAQGLGLMGGKGAAADVQTDAAAAGGHRGRRGSSRGGGGAMVPKGEVRCVRVCV